MKSVFLSLVLILLAQFLIAQPTQISVPALFQNSANGADVEVDTRVTGVGYDILFQSQSTGSQNGRTQLAIYPNGNDNRAFFNAYNSSDIDNSGLARLGCRGSYAILSATSSGAPIDTVRNVGIELDPGNKLQNEFFQISTGGFLGVEFGNEETVLFHAQEDGRVGIGTTSPEEKLTVAGTVYAQKVKVQAAAGTVPDYVFKDSYQLRPLSEVEQYVNQNSHLPDIPSADEVEKDGLYLDDMSLKLLQKVEELTLYLIEHEKKLKALEAENAALKNTLEDIQK